MCGVKLMLLFLGVLCAVARGQAVASYSDPATQPTASGPQPILADPNPSASPEQRQQILSSNAYQHQASVSEYMATATNTVHLSMYSSWVSQHPTPVAQIIATASPDASSKSKQSFKTKMQGFFKGMKGRMHKSTSTSVTIATASA